MRATGLVSTIWYSETYWQVGENLCKMYVQQAEYLKNDIHRVNRELPSVRRNPKQTLNTVPTSGLAKMKQDAPWLQWVGSCHISGSGLYCSCSNMNNRSHFFQKQGSSDSWSISHSFVLWGDFTWDVKIWEKLLEGFKPVRLSRIFLVPCIYRKTCFTSPICRI